MMETRTISTSIARPPREVATDLADPGRHPTWATEFFAGPGEELGEGVWRMKVPAMGGEALMRIDADIEAGIVDLYLAPLDSEFGTPLPVRVVPNGAGSDVLFSLARMPGQTAQEFQDGVESMERELANLKTRLEDSVPPVS